METLLIINGVMVGAVIYFVKDFHRDLKEVVKKVERLDERVKIISESLPKRKG